MNASLTERLGLDVPLIQAPMAGVSTPETAAAVCNAGGLGSVPLGALSADEARAAMAATRALTSRPFAVNVFTHIPPRRDADRERAYLEALRPLFEGAGVAPPRHLREIYRSFNQNDELLEVILAARPAVVSLHFGPAEPARMAALKEAGCLVLATATSVAEARLLQATGVDALVVQGYSAGGHSGAFLGPPSPASAGRAGLAALVADVAAAVSLPVVAAGGLHCAAGIRECLGAGAVAAQLGTAFVACPESRAGEAYRAALMGAAGTRLSTAISGRPARGLVNALLTALEGLEAPLPDYPLPYDAVKQLAAARQEPDFQVMLAGEGAAAARREPAGTVLARLGSNLL